jgi:hypothetical protein
LHQIALDDVCVLFALRRESMFFRREFPPHLCFDGAPCWAWFGGPAWLTVLQVETGVGAANVERVLDWLLGEPKLDGAVYRPKLVLFAGYAGALSPELKVGDLVLADAIVNETGHRWPTTWPGPLGVGSWNPPLHRGSILTADRLIATVEDKSWLHEKHGAIAVDMESAAFASRCAKHGVPFGVLRAVSDDARTPLSPVLASLLAGGAVSPWRLLTTIARRPRIIAELLRLGRYTKHASNQLGAGLGELLTLTLPWFDGQP